MVNFALTAINASVRQRVKSDALKMVRKRQAAKQKALSKEIRYFAQDMYDYIWLKQIFRKPAATKKFTNEYSLRLSFKNESKDSNFTESIGKAVRVTQFLLRDYFWHIFKFTISKKDIFKKEVKLAWSHWLDKRGDIFVKVIDTIAIIAETYLFCDCHLELNLEFNEITEWFIEWFEESLASDFFKSGGWNRLKQLVLVWCDYLFKFVDDYMNVIPHFNHLNQVGYIYDCNLINFLRHSPITFPVPESVLCDNCRLSTDENQYRRIVYVRLKSELQEIISLSEEVPTVDLPLTIQCKVKTLIKDEHFTAELLTSEQRLATKDFFPIIEVLQPSKVCKDLSVEVSKYNSIVNFQPEYFTILPQFSYNSPTFAKFVKHTNETRDSSVTWDFKEPLQKSSIFSEFYCIQESSPIKQIHEEQCLKKSSNVKALNNISAITAFIPEYSVYLVQSHFTEETSQISNVTHDLKKAPVSQTSSNTPDLTFSSTDSCAYLEKSLTTKNSEGAKLFSPVEKAIRHFKETKNEETTDSCQITNVYFPDSVYYGKYKEMFLQVLTKEHRTEKSRDQIKLYLISEKYSNSFDKMLEAYIRISLEKQIKSLQFLEMLTQTVPQYIESKQESCMSVDLGKLEFIPAEYRYYLIGK